jgi:hypothetical protein
MLYGEINIVEQKESGEQANRALGCIEGSPSLQTFDRGEFVDAN